MIGFVYFYKAFNTDLSGEADLLVLLQLIRSFCSTRRHIAFHRIQQFGSAEQAFCALKATIAQLQ